MAVAVDGPLRMLHLVGSAVDDLLADVSVLYARDALAATADPDRYEPLLAHVSPGGVWRFPTGLSAAELAAATPYDLGAAVAHLVDLAPDVALPQLFCVPGMTRYRALLDLLEIPYVGNTPEVMALGADKAAARAVVAAGGVAVPQGRVVRVCDLADVPGLPVVVKPVDADNSLGLSLVRDAAAYGDAVVAACAASPSGRALVERYIELGREVRCAVVDLGGTLVALPLEEYAVASEDHPIRTHDDKLARGADGELRLVAKDATRAWIVEPTDPVTAAVHEAALRCYEALGCRHYGLFDFRIDPDGRPWFLEAGLYCSYARQSVVSVMAAAAAIDLRELLAAGVALARHPHQES